VLTPSSDMERILRATEAAGTYFVVDEAFADFVEEASVKTRVATSKRLLVTRSMTKFYGLAGLRLGFLLAPKYIIANLKERKVPWSVNSAALKAGCASLEDSTHIERIRGWFSKERAFMAEELNAINGATLFEGSANFFLLKVDSIYTTGTDLAERLLQERIIVRTLTEFAGLGDEYIRVSIRERDDNTFLMYCLRVLLNQLAPGRTG
jgi:threonine-phosphate decarboxylase